MKIETLDKIFKVIYVGFLAVLLFYAVYMMTVLVISPKNDLENRGFVACTKQLVLKLGDCESGKTGCVFKAFYNDTKCNSKVITKGFVNWVKGNQSTPWSNYIFEPVWQETSDNPYLSNPKEDMENMAKQREFMLKKLNELEDAKNRALKTDETVIISDPEAQIEPIVIEEIQEDFVENQEQNISEESEIGVIDDGDIAKKNIEKLPEPKIKSDSEKIANKAKNDVLKEGN